MNKDQCFAAMQAELPPQKSMSVMDDYAKANDFIETLWETVEQFLKTVAIIPPKPVVMDAARMLIQSMLDTIDLPEGIEKLFMTFGLAAVSRAYDYFTKPETIV